MSKRKHKAHPKSFPKGRTCRTQFSFPSGMGWKMGLLIAALFSLPFGKGGDGLLFSQTVTPTYIGTTGNYSTMGSSPFWSISSSVGEPMVQTWSNGIVTITQGFQQPTPLQSCSLAVSINAVAIAGEGDHSLALKNDGTVWAWGLNVSGQLGNGTNTNSNVPVQVTGLTGITAIAAGQDHSLALKNDGTVWAWGYNLYGQLGNGNNTNSNVPVQVAGLTGITAIAGGGRAHSLALRNDGTVWAWGFNTSGQLGNGTLTNNNVPVPVSSLTAVTALAGGGNHSIALRNDGTVWAWGYNGYGQLGNGTFTNSNVPAPVSSLTAVTALAGGEGHSLALKNDGTVWTWGYNINGQLGNGTFTNSNVPVPVTSFTGVSAISSGDLHSLALKNDGTVQAWGNNASGQLGNGTFTNSNVPVPVSSLAAVTAIAGGANHSLALKNDGTVRAWGLNSYGQLGSGNNTDSNIPVQVITFSTGICLGESATLTATVSNGAAPYTYLWSTGATTDTLIVSPTITTTYSVVASDAFCSDTAYVTVVVDSLPTISITSSNDSICEGDSVVLIATTGGLTYVWSTGATTNPISDVPSSTTTYTVTGKDVSGCANTATTTVTVNPIPNITSISSNSPVCSGQTLSLTAGTDIGTTFNWNGPNSFSSTVQNPTIGSVSVTASGTYSVTTTSAAGCTSTVGTIPVTVNPSPTASVSATSNVICAGQSTTLTASGGSTYSWWNNSSTTSSITVSPVANTIYTVTATDGFGCTNDAGTVIMVNALPVITTTVSPTSICAGESSTLSAGGATTYVWSTGASTSSITVSPTTITNYTVTGTGNSCTNTATVSVTVNSSPTASINGLPSFSDTICNGNSTVLGATGGNTYSWWNNSSTTSSITVSPPTGITNYTVTVMNAAGCSDTAFATVTVAPVPTATASVNNASCFGICNGDATVTPTGGTFPYTYLWNDPFSQTTPSATGLCAGNYTSTVTDQSGCSVTNTVSITEPAAFSTTVSATSACNSTSNGTASVSVTGGVSPYSFVWSTSPIQTTSAATNLSGGNYTVDITDANGCTGSATVTVASSTVTASISGNTTICSGQSTVLTASGGSSYSWSNNATTSIITTPPLTSNTNYTVTVTDVNGCSDTAIAAVIVTAAPTAGITATSDTICVGSTDTLIATGGVSYSWSTGATTDTLIVNPTTQTIYTATVSIGSCSDTAMFTVNVSSVTASIISGANAICIGQATTLTASGGTTYSWWNNSSTTSSITVSPVANTIYTVTATNSFGCTDMDTVTVTVNSAPTVTVSTTYATICTGQLNNTTLTAGGGSSYLWSPASGLNNPNISNPIASPTASTAYTATYSVTVTNASGCSKDTSVSFSVVVNTISSPIVSPVAPSYCLGDSILPFTITNYFGGGVWTDFVGSLLAVNTLTYQPPQTLPLGVTLGWVTQGYPSCFADPTPISVTINDIPVVDAGNDVTICPGFTAHLEATISGDISGATYLWSPHASLNDSTIWNPSANPDSTITYALEVFNDNGCWAKDTITVYIVRTAECVIHVYNGITPNGDGANDIWWIDGIQSFPDNNVSIFNRWGNKVWEKRNYDNYKVVWKGTNQADQPLPDGTYYYIIKLFDKDGSVLYSATKWVEVTH